MPNSKVGQVARCHKRGHFERKFKTTGHQDLGADCLIFVDTRDRNATQILANSADSSRGRVMDYDSCEQGSIIREFECSLNKVFGTILGKSDLDPLRGGLRLRVF